MKFVIEELQNITEDSDPDYKSSFDGIYIFLSFDLANSTSFKNLNPNWPEKIKLFRDYCVKCMKQNFRPPEDSTDYNCCDLTWYIWKLLGDEIIFMFPNPKKAELFKLPDMCCNVLDSICKSMETPTKNNAVTLSVKATLWLADICNQKKDEKSNTTDTPYKDKNINISVDDGLHRMVDFLGPDIDTGFRLSHYSCHNKLAIDARLAWILYSNESYIPNHNKMREKAKIVSFKILKGVWNEKPYPIVWYLNDWDNEKLFYYFEELDENHLGYEISKQNYKFIEIEKLEKILIEAKQLDYSNYLYKQIEFYNGKQIEKLEEINTQSKISELHLIAICINEDAEILLLKRNQDRKFMPNVWDFGCTYLKANNTIEDSLKIGYRFKIGCEISLSKPCLPIASLSIFSKDYKKTQALVYFARVEKDTINLNKAKYSDFMWIKQNEYKKDSFEIFNQKGNSENKKIVVPDFFDRIEEAFNMIKTSKTGVAGGA